MPSTAATATTVPPRQWCEPFSVGKATSSTGTTVFDAGNNAAWTGDEKTGAGAYDTATVTGVPGSPRPAR